MRIIGGDHRLKAFLDGEVVVRKERTYETDRITVQSKQISNVPIHLSIYSPNVVNLTLIDLPRLTKVAVEGQSETIVEDVEMMVHSYVEKADNVSEGKRVSAFGLLSGVVSAATVCGTLAAQFLPIARIYQVAAVLVVLATVYLKIFLKETSRVQIDSALEEPILKSIDQSSEAKESFY